MNRNYFKIIRAGINTTFQDSGRNNLYHIGIPFSGAMDNRNYLISNKLVGNLISMPVIEFAYQGPMLKYYGDKLSFTITGDVTFKLKKDDQIIEGNCYETYFLENGDEIDILSTNRSVYGYLSISAEFKINFQWDSCSINTKIEKIIVIKGTNFNYFSDEGKKQLFKQEFIVSKLSDRMGMRLEGEKIENIVNTNIKSEGLLKGVIQVPADGNPIIMLSDHGTIGGYPKIGVVISADYDKLVQIPSGSQIKFQEVELTDAETLFKLYEIETQNLISQI